MSTHQQPSMTEALAELTPATLASTLASYITPAWAAAADYAVGPCPAACCGDPTAAMAYASRGGWAPWIRCTTCGAVETIEDLLTAKLGARSHAHHALGWALADPAAPHAPPLPAPLVAMESYYPRTKLISTDRRKDVTADAVVLGIDRRHARSSGEPMLVLDLGLFRRGAKARAPMFIPEAMPEFVASTLTVLAPEQGDEIDLESLVGRGCVAVVRAEKGEHGLFTRIAMLKPATHEPLYLSEVRALIAACGAAGRRP